MYRWPINERFGAPLFYFKMKSRIQNEAIINRVKTSRFYECYTFGFVKVFIACEMHAYSLNKRSSYVSEFVVKLRAILQARVDNRPYPVKRYKSRFIYSLPLS